MKQIVMRVTQSPMNPKRWILDLACGHEIWITSATKPQRKKSDCSACK